MLGARGKQGWKERDCPTQGRAVCPPKLTEVNPLPDNLLRNIINWTPSLITCFEAFNWAPLLDNLLNIINMGKLEEKGSLSLTS